MNLLGTVEGVVRDEVESAHGDFEVEVTVLVGRGLDEIGFGANSVGLVAVPGRLVVDRRQHAGRGRSRRVNPEDPGSAQADRHERPMPTVYDLGRGRAEVTDLTRLQTVAGVGNQPRFLVLSDGADRNVVEREVSGGVGADFTVGEENHADPGSWPAKGIDDHAVHAAAHLAQHDVDGLCDLGRTVEDGRQRGLALEFPAIVDRGHRVARIGHALRRYSFDAIGPGIVRVGECSGTADERHRALDGKQRIAHRIE